MERERAIVKAVYGETDSKRDERREEKRLSVNREK